MISLRGVWRFLSAFASLPSLGFIGVLLLFVYPGRFAWSFLLFLSLSTAVIYLVKWRYPLLRPDAKAHEPLRSRTLRGYWEFIDQGSFPSAHAARTAGLATLSFFASSLALQVFCSSLFFVVSCSRLALRRHYLRDVIVGMVLGVGLAAASWHILSL